MRKSSLSRLSVNGPPMRVIHEDKDGKGGRRSSKERQGNSSLGLGSQTRRSNYNTGTNRSSTSTSSGRPSTSASSRPSTSGNRFSMAPKSKGFVPNSSRTSGIGLRGRTDVPKDPRPVSDKRYVHKSIKALLEFLVTNNYPHATSDKLLAAPSSKDFFKMFEFIYSQLSPGYKLVNEKTEEEVPKLLKLLAYPFTISKMHLFSVGSPHVWPNMLAALIWMIDLIESARHVVEEVGIDTLMFHSHDSDDVSEKPEEKYKFGYYEKAYKAFMEGSDTYENENEELEMLLKLKYQGANIEHVMEDNEKLEQEVELLGQKEERLMKLQEKINMERQDVLKFENHTADLKQYKRGLATKLKTLEDDCALLQTEVQNDKQHLDKVSEIYENQDITPADVERMKEEREQLKRQIKQLEQQEESIDNDIFKTNIETAKIFEQAAAEVAGYNRVAADLKLIPSSSDNADGQDYSLMNKHDTYIPQAFEQVIKPKLIQMKKQCAEETRRKNKQKYQQTYQLEQLQETVGEMKDNLKKKTEELSRVEADVESLKQLSQKENKFNSTEKSRFEEVRSEYESQMKEAEDSKAITEIKFLTAQKEVESKVVEKDRRLQELEQQKAKVYKEVEDHKKALRAQLSEYVERLRKLDAEMDQRLDSVNKENDRRARSIDQTKDRVAKLQELN